jgi:hypothetical protein
MVKSKRRCGVCHERGHNSRTCPVELTRLQNRFKQTSGYVETYKSEGRPSQVEYYEGVTSRLAAKIAARTGIHPITKKAAKKGGTRRCSYCKYKFGVVSVEALGHTRRTCAALKDDLKNAYKLNAKYRAHIYKLLLDLGVGIGALISCKYHGWDPAKQTYQVQYIPCILTKIDWSQIDYVNARTATALYLKKIADITSLGNSWSRRLGVPKSFSKNADSMALRFNCETGIWGNIGLRSGTWDPGSPVNSTRLLNGCSAAIKPPAGWLSGESELIKKYYNDKRS